MDHDIDQLLTVVKAREAGRHLEVSDFDSMLKDHMGALFTNVLQCTPQPLAAKHKGTSIYKVSTVPAILFATIKNFDIYEKAVKRSATKLNESDATDIKYFEQGESPYEHRYPDCYSIVVKKSDPTQHYLYYVCNKAGRASSAFILGDKIITKEEVIEFCTPAEAKKIINPPTTVYNKTNDVEHDVQVRTVKLENIIGVVVNGMVIVA
jgi:hypothetical protein